MLLAEISSELSYMGLLLMLFVAVVMALLFVNAEKDDADDFQPDNRYIDSAVIQHLPVYDYRHSVPIDIRRIHHRSLMIRDEQMLLFNQACESLGVDPKQDSFEREVVDDLILNRVGAIDVDTAIQRLDQLRRSREHA